MANKKLTNVAALAGVSPTTVSRVINNYGYISQKTIDKVHKAMKELNYQPNSLARSLQGKKSQFIGIIFPSVKNPFFAELTEKIEKELFKRNYKIILCNCEKIPEKEIEYIKMLNANQVDGIITSSHNLEIEEYKKVIAPIVSFDRDYGPNIPIVSSDNYAGGQIATRALVKAGAKNIGIITGSNDTDSPTKLRLNGYLSIIKEFEMEPHVFEFKSNMNEILKEVEIERILKSENLDALFCTDDLAAIRVIKIAKKLNIQIPNDLKIIGYDGTELIQQLYPELSTIMQPIDDIATLLVEILLKEINDENANEQNQYTLNVKLLHSDTI